MRSVLIENQIRVNLAGLFPVARCLWLYSTLRLLLIEAFLSTKENL